MTGDRRTRILLVDDGSAACRGLRMWLALQPDLLIVGEAGEDADLAVLVGELCPDVILMDLERGRGCSAATAIVHSRHPGLPVVVLSLHDDADTRSRVRAAGAAAFVSKHSPEPLVATIRRVSGRGGASSSACGS